MIIQYFVYESAGFSIIQGSLQYIEVPMCVLWVHFICQTYKVSVSIALGCYTEADALCERLVQVVCF